MTHRPWTIFCLFLLLVLLITRLYLSWNRNAAPAPFQSSPDGTMVLSTAVSIGKVDPSHGERVIVYIKDQSGKSLHYEVTPASGTRSWSIRWASNDDILLNSSDVGPYHLHRQPDGSWKGSLGGP